MGYLLDHPQITQMNPDTETSPTPRTDAELLTADHRAVLASFSRQLERELTEKTNEVARLRDLLNRAIEVAEDLSMVKGLHRWCNCVMCKKLDAIKAEAALAPAPEEAVDKGEISDGYHTFNELYDHRCTLFLALIQRVPSMSWISKKHDDGSSFDGWFIAGMRLPSGDVTYHLPEKMWDLAVKTGAELRNFAPKWDGHKSQDVVIRLQEWIKLAAPAPEEPVIQDSRITEPVTKRLCKDCGQPHSKHTLHPYETICPEPTPDKNTEFNTTESVSNFEWRELGPDEVIQEGDEVFSFGMWIQVSPNLVIPINEKRKPEVRYRTRRPFPVQEEMPLEKELQAIENRDPWIDPTKDITTCIRYLRDEIQKLKAIVNKTKPNS